MDSRLLGGLSTAEFLADYWQKRPLLVRGAIPDFADPVSRDELAGLAMEDGVHARLIMEKGGKRPWQVEHGPFAEKRLRTLPRSHWTLLVSNVDRLVDDAADLLDRFAFIPGWRLDDLMVSFAPPQGTVGPHVDGYDVFLIQGQGRRRWGVQTATDPAFRPGLDLKILKRFTADEEWILERGDMLYLPPGVAHYGVALEECLTYSVGFRAPARSGLIQDLYNLPHALASLFDGDALYTDPGLEPQANPGEITAAALSRVEAIVRAPLERPDVLGRWFAAVVTRPDGQTVAPRKRPPTRVRLEELLRKGRVLRRSDDVRIAYVAPVGEHVYFYAGGEELAVPEALLALVKAVCATRTMDGGELKRALPAAKKGREAGYAFLGELFARGVLEAPRR